jgi:hypothetical protein
MRTIQFLTVICRDRSWQVLLFNDLPEDPDFGPFSNANTYVLDQLIAETRTDLKSSISFILH